MKIQKLTSTDAFLAIDFDDVPGAGITRSARKVLQDGAVLLARSTTYSFASFGIQRGGISIGINAEDDGRDEAVAAFVAEVEGMVREGRLVTDPGLGVTEAHFAPLRIHDPRSEEVRAAAPGLTLRGAVAAAGAVRDGGLAGARCGLLGGPWLRDDLATAVAAAGGSLEDDTSGVDVVFVAGKAGALDHEGVESIDATIVVPLTAAAVTARAHADLAKKGVVHVPDFLSIAAPLLAAHDPDGGDAVERVAAAVRSLVDQGTGLWMAAVERAEEFLLTWQDELPDFRPLA